MKTTQEKALDRALRDQLEEELQRLLFAHQRSRALATELEGLVKLYDVLGIDEGGAFAEAFAELRVRAPEILSSASSALAALKPLLEEYGPGGDFGRKVSRLRIQAKEGRAPSPVTVDHLLEDLALDPEVLRGIRRIESGA